MFKNLVFHRLPENWRLSAADLESQLGEPHARPCGPFDMSSRGWVPVTPGRRLLHTVNQQHMIALGTDDKLLPGSHHPAGRSRESRDPGRGAGLSRGAQAECADLARPGRR